MIVNINPGKACREMYRNTNFKLGPTSTPLVVKWTIISTLIVTLFSLIFHTLFTQILGLPSPQSLLSLTTWGVHKLFLWQFVSYLFVQPSIQGEVSITLVLQILFDLYLLWSIGSVIVQARGIKHFIGLYFGGGLFVGVVAYIFLLLAGSSSPFAGMTPCIYMILIGWIFLFPNTDLSLLLVFPIQAKWLIFGLIGIALFLNVSNGNFCSFLTDLASVIYAYSYGVFIWEMLGPFPRLHKVEKRLIYIRRKVKNIVRFSKIYDFKTGQIVSWSDTFMNACLEKISKQGKRSLTMRERLYMWLISKKHKK